MAFYNYKSSIFICGDPQEALCLNFLKETKVQLSELPIYPNLFAQAKFQKYAPVVGTVKSILTYRRTHSMGLEHFVERRKTMNKILYRKRIEMKRKQETHRMKILRSSKQKLQDSRCIFSAYLGALRNAEGRMSN